MLKLFGTINDERVTSQSRFMDGVANNGILWVTTQRPDIRSYNLSTLALGATATTSANPAGVCMINLASALTVSSSTGAFDLIEVSGGYRQAYTSGANACYTNQIGQQIAAHKHLGIALATRSTTGTLQRFNGNTFAITSLTASAVTGQSARCIIAKEGSNNWLVGTTDGKIHEVDNTGQALKTITVPNTPSTATAAVYISALNYADDYLIAISNSGYMYHYKYSTSTLLNTQFVGNGNGSTGGNSLSSISASGMCLMGYGRAPSSQGLEVSEVNFTSNNLTLSSIYTNEANLECQNVGFDPLTKKGWYISTNNSFYALRVFDVTSPHKTTSPTRLQDPPGTDIAGRIIRIRDDGIGRTFVEIDQNVSAGLTQVPCTQDHNYIELAIESGSPDKFDIRTFTS